MSTVMLVLGGALGITLLAMTLSRRGSDSRSGTRDSATSEGGFVPIPDDGGSSGADSADCGCSDAGGGGCDGGGGAGD